VSSEDSGRRLGAKGFTVLTEQVEAFPDPTVGQLQGLLAGLTAANRFLVLSRSDRPGEEHYAQVRFADPGHYDVEYRDGSAARHYAAVAPDVPTAHAVLTGWAEQRPGWRDTLVWKQIDVE
jgi:hypothetical protein